MRFHAITPSDVLRLTHGHGTLLSCEQITECSSTFASPAKQNVFQLNGLACNLSPVPVGASALAPSARSPARPPRAQMPPEPTETRKSKPHSSSYSICLLPLHVYRFHPVVWAAGIAPAQRSSSSSSTRSMASSTTPRPSSTSAPRLVDGSRCCPSFNQSPPSTRPCPCGAILCTIDSPPATRVRGHRCARSTCRCRPASSASTSCPSRPCAAP